MLQGVFFFFRAAQLTYSMYVTADSYRTKKKKKTAKKETGGSLARSLARASDPEPLQE